MPTNPPRIRKPIRAAREINPATNATSNEYSITRGRAKSPTGPQQRDKLAMNPKLVGYIDHPLGERDDLVKYHQNMENAGIWSRWVFAQTSQIIVLIPWWPMLVVLPENEHQTRLLTDQEFIIRKLSNILIQCGGFVSPHMMDHERIARRHNVVVAQLTQFAVHTELGPRPPHSNDRSYPFALKELSRSVREATPF